MIVYHKPPMKSVQYMKNLTRDKNNFQKIGQSAKKVIKVACNNDPYNNYQKKNSIGLYPYKSPQNDQIGKKDSQSQKSNAQNDYRS